MIKNNKKTVWHYLKIYFLSVFIGLIILAIGSIIRTQTLCANSKTCKSDLLVSVNNNVMGFFQGHQVIPPKVDLANIPKPSTPESININKHIYIDLSTQTLYAFEGSKIFMKTLISSGKWNGTPVGNFNIWGKLPVTRMSGGEGADVYDLPNVQWVMYFFRDFGLHGAYWHDNFGHPMSHGCVNMRLVDARELYSWTDGSTFNELGTAVSVCNQFTAPNKCVQN